MKALVAALLLAASPTLAQTPQTASAIDGDGRLGGMPMVERLDARALPAGQVHRMWFVAGWSAIGQRWLVPVIVVSGSAPGPRLVLTAAVHGDELTGIDVVHRLASMIDPAALRGTLVLVAGLNTPGILHGSRGFTPDGGAGGPNLNRLMPGDEDGDLAERYAHALWTRLLRPNADTLVDLHTQSRGTAYPMFAFAATPRARVIAELYAPDILKLDRGVKGTIENTMVDDGVPAITLELGRPEIFDSALAGRAVDGTLRLMTEMGMLLSAPPPGPKPFVANLLVEAKTQRGGFARLAVALGDDVTKGQPIGTVSDAFGRTIETVTAPEAGRISTVATTPLRYPGDMLARIVFWTADPRCKAGC